MKTTQDAVSNRRFGHWAVTAMVAPAFFMLGMAMTGTRTIVAREDSETAGPAFYKFGKSYVNLQRVSHVLDDPGQNLPPGSLVIHFGTTQSWLNLFGDEAEAFRSMIDQVTTDMMPKTTAASKKATPKRLLPSTKKTSAPSASAEPAAAPAARPAGVQLVDPGV